MRQPLLINKEEAKEILINELNYDPVDADLFLRNFPELNNKLEEAVKSWFKDRTVSDEDFGGITIAEIMKLKDYNFLLAVMQLNKLFEKDVTNKKRKRLIKSLKSPVAKL